MREPVDMNRPSPGWWLIRLERGLRAPFIPARIYWAQTTEEPGNPENRMERSPLLCAEVRGEPVDLWFLWHRHRVAISEEEYALAMIDAAAGVYLKSTWVALEKKEAEANG